MLKLNDKEKVRLVKRRHSFLLKLELLPLCGLFFLILFGMIIFPFFYREPEWFQVIYDYIGEFNAFYFFYFIAIIFLSFLWQVIFMIIASYYLDCWVVTNQRTIHTELMGLFRRYISSISHYRIQDVSVDVKGILGTYLNYGDVQIQTAGQFREFLFRQVPDPYETKNQILQAKNEFFTKRKR